MVFNSKEVTVKISRSFPNIESPRRSRLYRLDVHGRLCDVLSWLITTSILVIHDNGPQSDPWFLPDAGFIIYLAILTLATAVRPCHRAY